MIHRYVTLPLPRMVAMPETDFSFLDEVFSRILNDLRGEAAPAWRSWKKTLDIDIILGNI